MRCFQSMSLKIPQKLFIYLLSLFTLCLTSPCVTYILLRRPTFRISRCLRPCHQPQLVIVLGVRSEHLHPENLSKGQWMAVLFCCFPWQPVSHPDLNPTYNWEPPLPPEVKTGGLSLQDLASDGLPWWHIREESSCQCREHGFDPWSEKIPHVVEQLEPCPTTSEPVLWSPLEPTSHNYWSPCPLEPVVELLSRVQLSDPMGCSTPGSSVHGIFSGKNTGVGCHSLLQGISLTQGLNPYLLHLLHCRLILHPLSHQES